MHLFKRGATYWFETVYNGQRYRKSTKVKSRRAAEDIAAAFRTALAKGEVGITERRKLPFLPVAMKAFLEWSAAEHPDHPNTAKRYITSSKPLLAHFGKVAIDAITPGDVEKYKGMRAKSEGKRTKRQIRPATVNRELSCLGAMYNYHAKDHPNLVNPVSRVKPLPEGNGQDRVVSFQEQRLYLAAATPVLRDVAGLILECGCRPEEIYTLTRSQVDIARGFLKIVKGKTPAARRRIELTKEASRILHERLAAAEGEYLFPYKGDPSRPIPKVNNAHDRAIRDSKVRPFKLYALRHSFATRASEAGIDPVTLAAMLGHSRLNMVMRYAHPQQAHQSSAMQRLEAHNAMREMAEVGVATMQ